jgi:putative membrane protein
MRTLNVLTTLAVLAVTPFTLASFAEAKASKATESFVQNAAISNQFEILSSQTALSKSRSTEIKQFAQQMIDDHTQTTNQLNSTLPTSSADPALAKVKLDSKHQKILDSLNNTPEANFDQAYITAQTDAHNEAVTLFQDYAQKGDDVALKNFAAQTLPILQQHLDHAKQLKPAS